MVAHPARRDGRLGRTAGLGAEERHDLQLAVGEAAANAVEHAYRGLAGGTMTVERGAVGPRRGWRLRVVVVAPGGAAHRMLERSGGAAVVDIGTVGGSTPQDG